MVILTPLDKLTKKKFGNTCTTVYTSIQIVISETFCACAVTYFTRLRMQAFLQRYFLTYLLFGRCVEFPSLSRSLFTIVHLTRAEYHNGHSLVKRKREGVRYGAMAALNAAVIISSSLE